MNCTENEAIICHNCQHEVVPVKNKFTEPTIPSKCPKCGACMGCSM
jgi:DNA replicative helicase MCM subunit Mcm2 (Cdc46/Mcm family)